MPKRRGFLVSKRTSPQCSWHTTLNGRSFFYRQPIEAHVIAKAKGFSSTLCLLLVATSAEHTDWTGTHMVDPQISNLPKMIPEILNASTEKHCHFYWFKKTFHHKIVVNPENKIEFKGISVFFLSDINSFVASTNKRKKTGEWRRKGQLQTSEFPNNTLLKTIFNPIDHDC